MAKSFNFSLQKVLDVRKHTENQKAIELSKARRALQKEEKKLDQLKKNKEDIMQNKDGAGKKEKSVDLNLLKVKNDYIVQLNDNIENQIGEVDRNDKIVNIQHEKLIQAARDKKILEKLKERKQEVHKKEANLDQSKKDNEISIRVSMQNKQGNK